MRRGVWVALLVVVAVVSLGGNVWQGRAWFRMAALGWLQGGELAVPEGIRVKNRAAEIGLAVFQRRVDDERYGDVQQVKALSERVDSIEKLAKDVRDDHERTREDLKAVERKADGVGRALKTVVGELIRRASLPKEYSTVY